MDQTYLMSFGITAVFKFCFCFVFECAHCDCQNSIWNWWIYSIICASHIELLYGKGCNKRAIVQPRGYLTMPSNYPIIEALLLYSWDFLCCVLIFCSFNTKFQKEIPFKLALHQCHKQLLLLILENFKQTINNYTQWFQGIGQVYINIFGGKVGSHP